MNLRLKSHPLTKRLFLYLLASLSVSTGCNKKAGPADSKIKTDESVLKLGEGFDDLYRKYKDQTCVEFAPDPDADKIRSRVDQYFGKVDDLREILNHLGIGADGSFTYGVATGHSKMELIQQAQSTERSVSFLQWTRVLSKTARVMNAKLRPKYSRETCGNKYVNSVSYGAEMHVLVTLSFSTSKYFRSFEQSGGGKFGSWGELNAKVSQISSDIKKQGSITLRRTSSGDNLEHLASFFKGRDFVTCSLDNFADCQNLMTDIINYMNGPFGADAAQSTTVIDHELADYPGQNFPVDEKVAQQREALSDLMNKQVRDKLRASSLVHSGYLLPEDAPRFQAVLDDLNANVETIKQALVRCYDKPEECGNPINLKQYNADSLVSVRGVQVVNVGGSITNVTDCAQEKQILDELIKNCRNWYASQAPGEVENVVVKIEDIVKEADIKRKDTSFFDPVRECRRTVEEARCRIYVRL